MKIKNYVFKWLCLVLLILLFATPTIFASAYCFSQECESTKTLDLFDAIAADIKQNGVEQNNSSWLWHIKRIAELDETEYELLFSDSEDGTTISCIHESDGIRFMLTINKFSSAAYPITVTNDRGTTVASGAIVPETYTPDAPIEVSVNDNSAVDSTVIKHEVNTLVQLLQTHTVGHEADFTIKDFGFLIYEYCTLHAPGLRLVTRMPTCSEPGICEYDCQVCDTHITEVLPPFRPENQLDGDHKWKCESITVVNEEPHLSQALCCCKDCKAETERSFCGSDVFDDMPNDSKYSHTPIEWAYLHGLVSGTSQTTFSPKKTCTRAEIVTQLWRAAGSPEPTIDDNPFIDVPNNSYYKTAVMWAYENDITHGTGPNSFSPKANCTRAQIVTFIWKSVGAPQAEGTVNNFIDVQPDNWYFQAVQWALENNVTTGTSNYVLPESVVYT